ncbi:26208_t:CDS:2, partial [Gigaspora margarita]
IAAKAYHLPALVAIASVFRTEKKEHIDEHYCLVSIKKSLLLAKLFKQCKTINENITIADYDFPIGAYPKLISLVYLAIDFSDSNNLLCKGQLAIFVCLQYNV